MAMYELLRLGFDVLERLGVVHGCSPGTIATAITVRGRIDPSQ